MVTREIETLLERQRRLEKRRRPPVPKVPEPPPPEPIVEPPPVEPPLPVFERKEGEYLTQVEAEAKGWEFTEPLPSGWQIRVKGVHAFQVTPEGWEITERGNIISPEGKFFYTREEYEFWLAEQERAVRPEALEAIFPEEDIETMLRGIAVTPDMTPAERVTAEQAQEDFLSRIQTEGRTSDTEALLRQMGATEEQMVELFAPVDEFAPLMGAIARVFPERDVEETVDWAIEDRDAFNEAIEEMGRTEDTTALLRAVYPEMTEDEIYDFFGEPTKPTSNKFLEGIETGLQFVEGWWKTGLMEAGFGFYRGLETVFRPENRWTSEAEQIMDSAFEKHGWKAIFSDEVNEAWDIYFQERMGEEGTPAKVVAELSNPIWWAGFGGLAGLLAKPFSKIPVLGATLQGGAKTVQAAEEVVLFPLTAPLKGGLRFAGKAVGIKPTRPFLTDVLPVASELKATLFKNDTFRRVAQRVPGMKWLAPGAVIEGKLPVTLITKPEIESSVVQEILQRTAILEIGQGTKGQALAYLRELGSTRAILRVKDGICSSRWVTPRFKGESLALGDVIQAPERYIFKHKSGLEYCKRAQQMCREMYELATKEGIEIHRVGLEPFEEYVHWVCVGKIGKDGVLQMGRRGTRAVGGIVPAMKTRRFENMMDGIKAGYKYSDDLEIYVGSYVDDMFKAIGDKRLGDGLTDVLPKVEGMLPVKPLDRLIALYPEREIAWTGIRKEMADLGYAWSAVKRAARGEILPPVTIRALERRIPKYAEKLAAAGTDKKALRALSKELKTTITELKPAWWKARYDRSTAMEIVRKPILGREEGFIRTATGYAHPMFQNQIYPRVIADKATALLNAEAAAFWKVTAGISAAFRMQIAVLDISAWCIQGLMAQFTHPLRALRANVAMIEALIKPKIFQQFLVKNAPSINERIYYLGAQRPFEYFESMGWFVKMAGKLPGGKAVVGETFGRAQASFSMWSTVYKDLMWQANAKYWIKAGQGAEFARYLDRMTGMMSFNQLGMPANASAFLAGWVSFAPQYRFSVLSWFSHLFKGGMIGTEARKDLAKMVAGAAISYTAFCKVTDNPVYLDPYKDGKKFMSINVDGHWIGIGAAVVSMIRASMDIAASALSIDENEPMDFLTLDKWQNPLMRTWFMQSAVLPRMISEIAQRRDFLGYPLESVEDWAGWAGEQVTPIWLQDIFFDKTGVPITPLSVLGNFAGLRTSPQTRWETLNDKLVSLKTWEVVTDLTDDQRERIEAGETVLSVLDRFQKTEMFNAFPELIDLYEEAIADALNRSSQVRKNYEMATTSIKEEAVDNLAKAMDIGVKLDGEDTRWLRDRYGDVMNIYGAKNDILRDVEEYQDMFDEWDEAREERKPEAELVDLAYWEYIEDVVSPDYELPNGDFDFKAYDQALVDFKDKWGEEIFDKIVYVLENNKAEYPDWAVKLWKDRLELNEGGYWKLPYKLISKMDEDDEKEGNIPEEYLSLWGEAQALEGVELIAFLEEHPILTKDWRLEHRQNNPEDDAQLALWGYGGKLQSTEAYDFVLKWTGELGIPLEQVALGLPPPSLIKHYFDLNKIVSETSGSSLQARLFKLEHPPYLAYGVEQWGWDDLSDESVDALFIRVKRADLTAEYESFSDKQSESYIEDKDERREKQNRWREIHSFYVADMRRAEVFELSIDKPEALAFVDTFAEYGRLIDEYSANSAEALLFRARHPAFNRFGLQEKTFTDDGWEPLDDWKVPMWEIDVQMRGMDEETEEYKTLNYKRGAYENRIPENLVNTYIDWYTTKRTGYYDDWFLKDHRKFYEIMVARGILQERDFTKVPSREIAGLLAIYKGIVGRQAKLDFRAQNGNLETWLVEKEGYTPIGVRGDPTADISREEKLAREIAEGLRRIQELGE